MFEAGPERAIPRVSGRTTSSADVPEGSGDTMIVLGVILLVIGFVIGIPVLWTIGIILALVGVAFAALGATGRAIGGRAHWF
jgi:hypothetical protein